MLNRACDRRGQGLAEYLIVLALVCLFLVFIVSEYGTTIRFIFNGSGNKLDQNVKPRVVGEMPAEAPKDPNDP